MDELMNEDYSLICCFTITFTYMDVHIIDNIYITLIISFTINFREFTLGIIFIDKCADILR